MSRSLTPSFRSTFSGAVRLVFCPTSGVDFYGDVESSRCCIRHRVRPDCSAMDNDVVGTELSRQRLDDGIEDNLRLSPVPTTRDQDSHRSPC